MHEAPEPMPTPTTEQSRDVELLNEVMRDHGVTITDIADATGINHGHVSRFTSGQYVPTPAVWRYLWQKTSDQRIVAFLLGEDREHLRVSMPRRKAADSTLLLLDAHVQFATVAKRCWMNSNPCARTESENRDIGCKIITLIMTLASLNSATLDGCAPRPSSATSTQERPARRRVDVAA